MLFSFGSRFFSIVLHTLVLCFASEAFACGKDPADGFLPPNDVQIPPRRTVYDKNGDSISGGLDEEEYHGVIDAVERIYAPIVQELGADLVIHRNWEDGTVNASTSRSKSSTWNVRMYGGLARHREITLDGFMLVLCHELGHHLGGAPKKTTGNTWSSAEGESDYFSTLKCARRVLEREDNIAKVETMYVPQSVRTRCEVSFRSRGEAAICIRSALGGLAVSRLLASIREYPEEEMPWFNSRDKTRVSETYERHPVPQCRLDTLYAGALCSVDFTIDVDPSDPLIGTCATELGDRVGARPRCWYAPESSIDGEPIRSSREVSILGH